MSEMGVHDFAKAVEEKRAAALAADAGEPPETPDEPEAPETPEVPETPEKGDEPDGTEPDASDDGGTDDAARDEHVAKRLAELPDDATAEEREQAERDAADEFYVGRFKTREEAERGIAERDRYLEQLERERADLRRQLQEARETAAEPEPLNVPEWEQWARTAVEEGSGEQGALKALQSGGMEGYQIYLRAWMADPDQVADATIFNNAVMMEAAEIRAAQAATQAPAATGQDEAKAARDILQAKRPDLAEYMDKMDEVVESLDESTKAYLASLNQQGVDGKVMVLDYLYLQARDAKGESAARARQVEADRRRTSAEAAKVRATVASSEASATRTPPSEAELQVIRAKNVRRVAWGMEPLPEE